jgi:homoserine kinase
VIVARAPASTANLGPGFDAVAAALDLWNTVEVDAGPFSVEIAGEGAGELPRDLTHLALQAFALVAEPGTFRFRFENAIPLERGLGSSAAAIGLGLVAGAAASGHALPAGKLLTLGAQLESHLDNLAAVVHGGVTAVWRSDGSAEARRIAIDVPAELVAVVPAARTQTAGSRTSLPDSIAHDDAAQTAGAALLLGAALAAGDGGLLQHAFRDQLHEPYRAAGAPLLERVRASLPAATLGATLSGSGPTVLVWAERGRGDEVTAALRTSVGDDATVLPLAVSPTGAAVMPPRSSA